jgi:chromate transport protein ChrA
MTVYYVLPVLLLLLGLVLFLPNWKPEVKWIGKFLTGIALIVLAIMFLASKKAW